MDIQNLCSISGGGDFGWDLFAAIRFGVLGGIKIMNLSPLRTIMYIKNTEDEILQLL